MCAIPQLVSAPLNPISITEHFRRSRPQCEHSYSIISYSVMRDTLKMTFASDLYGTVYNGN